MKHSREAQALLEKRASQGANRSTRIPAIADRSSVPLSSVQQMVWLSTQLDKTASVYNRCSALRIVGSLDHAALQLSLTEIARRHPILRSRVEVVDDQPRLRSLAMEGIPLPVTDLSNIEPAYRTARVRKLLEAEARRPFDLEAGPFLRAGILKEDEETSTLYISTHHIATDGWSDGVMFRELHALYAAFTAGKPSPLAELTAQYADFVVWQRDRIEGSLGKRNAEYWRARMDGAPPMQELPTDRPKPVLPSTSGGQTTVRIERDLAASVESLARHEAATPAITMLAAFALLQSRITGQLDTVIGLSLAGRTHTDLEPLIGLFNTVVPVRVTVDREMSFRDLLRVVRVSSLEAQDHQEVSVDAILESLPAAQSTRHPEIAQTVFNFRNMPAFEPSLSGLEVQTVETFNGSSVSDLELEVVEDRHGWECALRFRSDQFAEATAARIVGHYVTLLHSIAANPDEACGRLSLLTDAERRQLLLDFQGPVMSFGDPRSIHELILDQAAKTPDGIAVSSDEGALTYHELDSRSNALSHHLISRGVTPSGFVGVCMERSLEMIICLVAILKSGGAIVPLDPDYPIDRLAYMLGETRPVVLLADSTGASLLGDLGSEVLQIDAAVIDGLAAVLHPPLVDHESDAVACVLYTSGSTGRPKGVLSTHRGIVNNLRSVQAMYGLTADDTMLLKTSLGFDAAAWEIFWPLSVGARVHLAPPGGQRDSDYLVRITNEQRVATVGFAPSMLKVMLDLPGFTRSSCIKRVMAYGEVLPPQIQEKLFALMPGVELHNLYGPTETSITVTSWECERGSTRRTVPIGRPMTNTEVYILDSELQPAPIGVAGEVYIGGVCVSRGYYDQPALTAERFLPHPFRGGDHRVYRTGDIARFGPDGVIEYMGRRDHQLKIRGLRVELEEVEAALESLPGVSESVVVATVDDQGEYRLTAYIAVDPAAPGTRELRRALERRLPPQFLPSRIVPLDSLPHGPNGKVDRARLPEIPQLLDATPEAFETPRTDFEQRVAIIWKEILHLPEVSIGDSFFDLGGHSLLAVRMLQRLADDTGESVSLRAFYEEPTIRAISRMVASEAPVMTRGELPPMLKVRESRNGASTLFYLNGQPAGGGKYARRFVSYLLPDQGLYIVPVPILATRITVEELAQKIVDQIRAIQAEGPYLLGGNCFGATLAFEVAQQLSRAGKEISLVALIHPDARAPMHLGFRAIRRAALLGGLDERFHFAEFPNAANYVKRTVKEIWQAQQQSSPRERWDRLKSMLSWLGSFVAKHSRRPFTLWSVLRSRVAREADEVVQDDMLRDFQPVPAADPTANQQAQVEIANHARHMSEAWTAYNPKPYSGRVAIIWPVEGPANPPWNPTSLWMKLTPNHSWYSVPGNHWTMLHHHFDQSARALGKAVEAVGKASV